MRDYIHYSVNTPWVEKAFNGKYPVRVPAYMLEATYAAPGLFDNYEQEHLASMRENLGPDDILFDIGAETGWLSALFARHFVNGNVCLFEPSNVQWPSIKAIWEANCPKPPLGTWAGFVADKDFVPEHCHFRNEYQDGWPYVALTPYLNEQNQFRGFCERGLVDIPSITVDSFVRDRGIVPTAITLDIEGAEFLAMRGAHDTLKANHPKVWMSIHMHPADGFVGDWRPLATHTVGPLLYDYHHTRSDILAYMDDLGYKATYLGYSCEENWFFERTQ